MSGSDPSELVVRIRRHDVQALAEYLEHHRPRLLVYVERRLGAVLRRKVEAEDILQEAGIEALRALPQTSLEDREPFGWLCQIAERRIIDAHRRFVAAQKRGVRREVALEQGGDDSRAPGLINLLVASMTSPSQAFSRNRRIEVLREALAALPEEAREALRLRYLEGLPSKEVAHRLGKTDGAVRVLLTRTLHRLHADLASETA